MSENKNSYHPTKHYHKVDICYFPDVSTTGITDRYVIHLYRFEEVKTIIYKEYKIFNFVIYKKPIDTKTEMIEVRDYIYNPMYTDKVYKSFDTLGEAEDIARKLLSKYVLESKDVNK